jgi:soluble lytic murein transglycosylase-like protein
LAVAIAALLLSSVAAPFAASAQNAPIERETASHPYAVHVADAARRFGIPEAWIWAVMRIESNGDARAVSTAGAMGLMQIMPATWATLRARYRLGSDPFNAHDNIMAGTAYLREMHDRYGDVTAMLAAYNAGPGRYDEHLSRGRPLPGETVAYLAKLAPITGGADDTQLAAAPAPDPFAWRRAALFAVRSAAPSTVPPDTANHAADVQAERPLTESAGVAMAAITPLSAGLFVPVSRRSPQ